MGRHQIRLLLCSAASVALLAATLFTQPWFRLDLGPAELSIGLRSARMCAPGAACQTLGLDAMAGPYPAVAAVAFWSSLALALLVLGQCTMKLATGASFVTAMRASYVLGSIALPSAFAAGYLFTPEMNGMFDLMGVVFARTLAPVLAIAGSLLGILAARYTVYDDDSGDGEYRPIVVHKHGDEPRLPVTPLHAQAVTPPAAERTAARPARERLPDVLPLEGGRPRADAVLPADAERTKPPSQPPAVARTSSASQPPPTVARTSSASPPPPTVARTSSASQPPAIARTGSTSQPPVLARTALPQYPLESRTKSPSQPPRTRSAHGSEPPSDASLPADLALRARTSSSGPIDLAARLSGAPIAVAIKPPPPEPIPVPPDQIPVAPESGLVIRKRTASAGPLSPDHIPVAPESGLVIRTRPSSAAPPTRSKTPPDAMPTIGLPPADDKLTGMGISATAAATTSPLEGIAPTPARTVSPLLGVTNPLEDLPVPSARARAATEGSAVASLLSDASRELAAARGNSDVPGLDLGGPTERSVGAPPRLRGKLRYAVTQATLTSVGIDALREDGATKHVVWDAIVGIIARRLPGDEPYGGETFVDVVSTHGSTLRILPWTLVTGAPLRGEGEERARSFVRIVAAQCLQAKLDAWTKVFAEGAGHAAQLPSAKTLAAHDEIIA